LQIPDDDLESENPAALPTDDPPPSPDDTPSTTGTIPKRSKRCNAQEQRLEKAFNILEASASKSKEETECEIFGKFIGRKLEKYSSTTRINVQQAIMNIMFSADREHYEPRYEQQPHPNQSNRSSSYPTSLNRSSQYSVPSLYHQVLTHLISSNFSHIQLLQVHYHTGTIQHQVHNNMIIRKMYTLSAPQEQQVILPSPYTKKIAHHQQGLPHQKNPTSDLTYKI